MVKWSDVDTKRRILTVNHSIGRDAGKIWEDSPKSSAAREVPMTRALMDALASVPHSAERYVLADESGAPIAERKLRETLKQAQTAAGLKPTARLHVLRRSLCSRLAARGAAVRYIQQLAGHANITTTERYLHSDEAGEPGAIALLDGARSVAA